MVLENEIVFFADLMAIYAIYLIINASLNLEFGFAGIPNFGEIFDSGIISPGSTFEHTFEDSGTYDYFCIVHPWMIGTVQVQ